HSLPWHPPFLRNVAPSARREFSQIVSNQDATKGQIKKRVRQWALRNHVEVQVNSWHRKLEGYFTEHRNKISQGIRMLLGAYERWTNIVTDDTLTRRQSRAKIHDLFVSYLHEVRDLLSAIRPRPHRR
ncbi:hypothetical protein PENTCL1PPCAC_30118, partial [Pristionchus entomophagus]